MSTFLSRIHVHLVWGTRCRRPTITADVENAIHGRIVEEVRRRRCHVLAIGGVEDHVHVLLWLHPACSVASLVSIAKTASSRMMHQTFAREFAWQTGYAAFAVQPRAIEPTVRYVRTQRHHHGRATTIPALEEIPRPDDEDAAVSWF